VARWIVVVSTAYCLSGTMADGTGVRWGSVASNQYPLGTVLEVAPAPAGRRRWTVRDRIGWGTQLDFWNGSCTSARGWGRHTVRIRRWRRPHLIGAVRGTPVLELRPSSTPARRCCRPQEIWG
jgi:3D (Asp-Asp-Asp) domain-containing protein